MTLENGQYRRRCRCWIEAFEEYTKNVQTPGIFRKWAAISAVAGALERRIWARSMGKPIYANSFTLLVAPPGIGKTNIIEIVDDLWRQTGIIQVAPHSVTRASLVDAVRAANRRVVLPDNSLIEFNSLAVCAPEFSVLIPGYENEFVHTLNYLWDNPSQYDEKRRGNRDRPENEPIYDPQVHILGGTTPSFLADLVPEGAWSQGFMARFMLIYSGDTPYVDIFDEVERNTKLYSSLISDLTHIASLYGAISFDEEVKQTIRAWRVAGCPPTPEHNRLEHYSARRTLHLLKLLLAVCLSRSDTFHITMEHYQSALDFLLEAEASMPDVFKAMVHSSAGSAMDDTWHYVYSQYARTKKPLMHHQLLFFLRQKVPVHAILPTVEIMVKSNLLRVEADEATGKLMYHPIPKHLHGQPSN